MSLRSLTPDVYGTKKNTDLPMYVNFFPLSRRAHVDTNLEPRFNKFTPKKHSSRLLFKRGLYTLVFLLLTYTIYSKVIVGESPRLPTFSKSDIENNLEQEIEIQRQQQQQQEENDSLNDDHQQFKVTKDGIQEVSDPMEITTEDLKKSNVEYFDLGDYQGSSDGNSKGDIVLFLMPLRNAEHVLPMAFYNLMNLTYDHLLIDIAFLVSDCSPDDTTLETVFRYSMALQNGTLVDLLKQEEQQQNGAQVKGSNDLYQSYMEPLYMESVK